MTTGCDREEEVGGARTGSVNSAAPAQTQPDTVQPVVAARNPREQHPGELWVCADPNNLPFSNERREGFENRIADVIAKDLNVTLRYHWAPQRRGWVRNGMRDNWRCDIAIGVPSTFEMVLPTRPYYRSTYVFVSRKDRGLDIRSLDDPALKELKIGVHVIGDDYNNTPPAHALSKRGIIRNVVGYSIYGDYSEEDPPARLIEAVAEGDVDLAIAWGPLAGYFAKRLPGELEITPVSPAIDLPFLPMVYDMSLGVRRTPGVARREDREAEVLRAEMEEVLARKAPEIRAILQEYGVPVVGTGAQSPQSQTESTQS